MHNDLRRRTWIRRSVLVLDLQRCCSSRLDDHEIWLFTFWNRDSGRGEDVGVEHPYSSGHQYLHEFLEERVGSCLHDPNVERHLLTILIVLAQVERFLQRRDPLVEAHLSSSAMSAAMSLASVGTAASIGFLRYSASPTVCL